MRALDLYGLSRRAVEAQSEATRAALEAYADGVNAWLKVVQAEALGRGAPEFFLFDAMIAPWIPADSIAVQKLMALQLTDKAALETLRARLSLRLPPERLRDILPDSPNAPVMGLPEFSQAFPTLPPAPAQAGGRAAPARPGAAAGLAGASNAFAAMGERAAGGAPLLATDPHLPLTAPSIWMLARMDLAEGPVIGGTIPGIPAVLVGRNADLGWGLTSSYLDDQDVYHRAAEPRRPRPVPDPAGLSPLRDPRGGDRGARRRAGHPAAALVAARAGDPGRPLRRGGDHPARPRGDPRLDRAHPRGPLDRRRHRADARAFDPRGARGDRGLRGALAEPDAGRPRVGGAADGGRRRRAGRRHTSQGRIPAPGWLAVNDWQGMRDFEENPWVIDPPSGIVVNTNNRITDAAFPDHLSFDWGDAYRIMRAGQLLNGREYHSLDSFIEIQTDTVSEAARVLLPLIARDLWYSGEPAAEATRRAAAAAGAGAAGQLERRDVRAHARAADLRRLGRGR